MSWSLAHRAASRNNIEMKSVRSQRWRSFSSLRSPAEPDLRNSSAAPIARAGIHGKLLDLDPNLPHPSDETKTAMRK
jgi:hypothetical protein